MNEERFTELAIKISSELGTLNANMNQVLSKIAEHDQRLRDLETTDKKDDFKSVLINWLMRGFLISLGIIATLTGSASIIKQIFKLDLTHQSKNTLRFFQLLFCCK